jgi:hypothetical protein
VCFMQHSDGGKHQKQAAAALMRTDDFATHNTSSIGSAGSIDQQRYRSVQVIRTAS